MASNLMVEYCISLLKSRGEEARAARMKLLNMRQENLDSLLARFVDLKQHLNMSENRLIAELTWAYDVELDRYDACLTQISDRINEARASNKIDMSEVEIPAPWSRRFFVKCMSAVKEAVEEMKLGSKTDETWLETNTQSPQVDEKFNVAGSPAQYSTPQSQSQPNQINVNVTFSTDKSTTKSKTVSITKQASSIDTVTDIQSPKKKILKRPAEQKTCPSKQTNEDGSCSTKKKKPVQANSKKSLDTKKAFTRPTKKKVVTMSIEKTQSKRVVKKKTVSTTAGPAAKKGKKEQLCTLRDIVSCKKCIKARCVYSKEKLTERQRASWEEYICSSKKIPYYCGFELFPKDHKLKKVMWVEKDLKSCETDINPHYYGFRKWPPLCYKCGGMNQLEDISAEDQEEWLSIDPACRQCILWKRTPGPRKRRRRVRPKDNEAEDSENEYESCSDESCSDESCSDESCSDESEDD